ncbi:MAG: hydrolase, partial [Chlamydiia bacterium]|nr:hydrolase [Chlamydiia bacterium]
MRQNLAYKEWFKQNHRGWRLFVGLVCVICLALFLHFRQIRLEILELNQKAGRYVIASVDFEFPDDEMTLILKQQAMQDVGKIYQLDDQEIKDIRLALEQKLIRSKEWREASPASTFEQMYKAADELETLLLEIRLTDPRTIQMVREMGLPDDRYFVYLPEDEKKATLLPGDFWSFLAGQMEANGVFSSQTAQYVISPFQQNQWTLHEDLSLEQTLRVQVSKTVPAKLTKVYAGMRILNPDETVTQRHMIMMQAMKEAIAEGRRLSDPLPIVANLLLSFILVMISALYFRISQPTFIRSLQQVSLFVAIVILTLFFAKVAEYVLVHSSSSFIASIRYPIVAPFATLLICILLSPTVSLFAATFLSII